MNDGVIAGDLNWIHDPFFRPSVGLYIEGSLAAAAPTWRAPSAGRGKWICSFEIAAPLVDLASIEIACLESGEILPGPDRKGGHKDLAAMARASRRPAHDLTGFPSFIGLPHCDQIRLLYLSYLGRSVDSDGLDHYQGALAAGVKNILDIRDDLISSAEFAKQNLSPSDKIGRWIVWSGLAAVSFAGSKGGLLTPELDARPLQQKSRREIPELLAGLALGVGKGADRETWLQDHQPAIASFVDTIAEGSRSAPTRPFGPKGLSGLETAMHVGEAGQLVGTKARSLIDAAGVFAYGPYLRLPVGAHRLESVLRVVDGGAKDASVGLEIVHRDRLLRFMKIPIDCGVGGTVQAQIEFSIPESVAALAQEAAWEFRLSSDGRSEIELVTLALAQTELDSSADEIGDLLPIMSASAGSARENGGVSAKGPGNVLFGPYRDLFPGVYELKIDLGRVDKPFDLSIEITRDGKVQGSVGVRMSDRAVRLCVPFEVGATSGLYEIRFSVSEDVFVPVSRLLLSKLRHHFARSALHSATAPI